MNFFVGYLVGFWNTLRNMKMWLLLYFLVLGFAFICAVPVFKVMNTSIGDSLEIQKLLPAYDNTVYRDFMNVHGEKLEGLSSFITVATPFVLLFFVFLTGGILQTFNQVGEQFNRQNFWSSCSRYFGSILSVFLLFSLLQIFIAVLLYAPFFKWIFASIYTIENELIYVKVGLTLVIIHFFMATYIATVSDYTKVRMIQEDRAAVLREIWRSFGWVKRHFFKAYPLFILNVLTAIALFGLYLFLEDNIGMVSVATLVVMFVVQQVFVFLRLGAKLMTLASAVAMYRAVEGKDADV